MRRIACLMILCQSWCIALLGQDSGFMGYASSYIDSSSAIIHTSGFKDKAKTIKYDSLTLQPVGSTSKVVIGLAVMKACELGFVNLDTDINVYLKFKVLNPNIKGSQSITLRHLATHTSGIRDNEKFYLQAYTKGLKSPLSLEQYLISYLDRGGARYSARNYGNHLAGEEYSYSNIGAALAAYVIECASKMAFDQFTAKFIFLPLNMKHTHWFYEETELHRYTQLFDEKDNPIDFYALATYPDGAMKTNIVDLTRLLQALISGYRGESTFLNRDSWSLFFEKNFTTTKPVKGVNLKEPNMGIFVVYAKSGAIGHTGSDPGLCSFMFFDPEKMTGRIFIGNEDLTKDNQDAFKAIWGNLEGKR